MACCPISEFKVRFSGGPCKAAPYGALHIKQYVRKIETGRKISSQKKSHQENSHPNIPTWWHSSRVVDGVGGAFGHSNAEDHQEMLAGVNQKSINIFLTVAQKNF